MDPVRLTETLRRLPRGGHHGRMPESWEGVDFDEVDVLDSEGMPRVDARLAGDEAVDGLDKITAQMAGGEHRSEQQEMCRAVAEALATRTTWSCRRAPGRQVLAYLVSRRLYEGGQ